MDIDKLAPGLVFEEAIKEALDRCDVFLALIGMQWLSALDRRRVEQQDDLVRLEIEAALARSDVRVIPVLVQDAEMPSSAQLPESLAGLARRHAAELSDTRWRYDLDRLVEALQTIERQKHDDERLRREQALQAEQVYRAAAERRKTPEAPVVTSPISDGEPRVPATSRRRNVVVATAIAIGVLAAAVVGIVLVTARGDGPVEDAPAATGSSGSTGGTATGSAVPLPFSAGDGDVYGATAAGSNGVAVGYGGPKNAAEAIWTLTGSGNSWQVAESTLSGPTKGQLNATARAGSTLVAVGWKSDGAYHVAAGWHSSDDGDSWLPARFDWESGDELSAVAPLAAGGWIAVGKSLDDRNDAAAWYSSDGTRWTKLEPGGLAAGGHQRMNAVSATASGVVAVGYDSGSRDAAVWTAGADGSGWQRQAGAVQQRAGDVGEERMADVVRVPVGFVAVGWARRADDDDAAVWLGAKDGKSWRRADGDLVGEGDQQLQTVVAVGEALLAGGFDTSDGVQRPALWRSDDGGQTWERFRAEGLKNKEGAVRALAAAGDEVIAVGFAGSGEQPSPAGWVIKLG